MAWDDNIIPSFTNNYARTANANARPYSGIVVHVTGKQTLGDELNWMKTNGQGLGYHYMIDRDGKVYQTAPLDKRMNQVLPDLDKSYNNNNSLGIAMVAGGKPGEEPPPFTPAQLEAGKTLVDGLRSQYNIPTNRVVGHGQIQTDREAGNKLNAAGGYEGQDFINYYGKGAQPNAAPATQGTTLNSMPLSPEDRDYIIRTVAGEADHPAGDAAVASVIKNRLASGQWGNTGKAVVTYPGQFSAWNKVTGYGGGAGGNSLVNIDSSNSSYQRIGAIVDDVFSGKTADPTGGALNFYAPGGMPGGKAPGWWDQVKNPIRIGAQWYGTAPSENASVTGRPTPGPGRAPSGPAPTPGVSPPAAATPGTTINTASSAGGVIPGFGTKEASDAFRQNLGDFDKALGGPGLDGQQGDQQRDLKPPTIMAGPGLRNYPGIAGVEAQARQMTPNIAQQLYGQTLNSQPLAWSNAAIPAPDWLAHAGQQGAPGIGTSLNSMQMAGGLSPYQLQMMMNPMMLDQGGGNG